MKQKKTVSFFTKFVFLVVVPLRVLMITYSLHLFFESYILSCLLRTFLFLPLKQLHFYIVKKIYVPY